MTAAEVGDEVRYDYDRAEVEHPGSWPEKERREGNHTGRVLRASTNGDITVRRTAGPDAGTIWFADIHSVVVTKRGADSVGGVSHMRCDLCTKGSEAGPVLLIEATPPAFERRKPGPRRQHQLCADNVAARRAEEKAKTVLWLDRQFAEFAAARRLVTT